MAFCPSCGQTVNPGASFCTACGANLAPAAGSATPVAAGATTPQAAVTGPGQGVRPMGVTIIGMVTLFVSAIGAIAILFALFAVMISASVGAAFAEDWMPFLLPFGGAVALLAIFALVFAGAFVALGIVTGVGVLKGRSWAWGLMIVLMALAGVNSLFDLARQDVGGILGVAVSGIVIWYFFQPDVKRWFGRA